MAVVATTVPLTIRASFVVPPPMSTWMMVVPSRRDRATAPEPCAASVASRAWPAVAQTNFPPSRAKSSSSSRALCRSRAAPVRITAPVSTSSRASPASRYQPAMAVSSAAASIVSPAAYGVRTMGER